MEQFEEFEELKKMEWNGIGEMWETNKGLMAVFITIEDMPKPSN